MAAKDAKLHHGDPLMGDYTPGAAVRAGEVVVVGSECWIAHNDIEANQLGAMALPGGNAVYSVVKDGLAANPGDVINWDGSAATTGAGTKLGVCVAAAGAGDARVHVRHEP